MMPEEWPIAAPAADRNAPARTMGRDRMSTVRTDFFLNPAERLSEQERALMTAMLHCLVGDIADEIRAALPAGWVAANDEHSAMLVEALNRARLLDHPRLMALLLDDYARTLALLGVTSTAELDRDLVTFRGGLPA